MKSLYIDCDGVILNTIEKALNMMKEEEIDTNDFDLVHKFFVEVNWHYLIECAGVLDNSLEKIRYLQSLKNYYIRILTTCVNSIEPIVKRNFFKENLPGVPVITVPWLVPKNEIVLAKNSILVDDSLTHIRNWRRSDGIGLHFVSENANNEKMEIDDLLDIPNILREKRLERHI